MGVRRVLFRIGLVMVVVALATTSAWADPSPLYIVEFDGQGASTNCVNLMDFVVEPAQGLIDLPKAITTITKTTATTKTADRIAANTSATSPSAAKSGLTATVSTKSHATKGDSGNTINANTTAGTANRQPACSGKVLATPLRR